MKTETLNLTINHSIIVDQVAAFLYATKVVEESTEITDIKFGNSNKGLVPIAIYTRKEVLN